jgi:NADPH:quinone reductase-like Zn-dependent oxidoreductase
LTIALVFAGSHLRLEYRRILNGDEYIYPLTDAAQAHERSETGRARGKIVLQVS